MSCQTVFQHHSLGGHAMKRFNLILAGIGFALGLSSTTLAADDDWAPVAQALGRSGAQLPGGIYRVGLGRSDLKVTLDGVEIRPTLALGSYLAFQKMGSEAMVMGDLVLLHEEVNPVMKKHEIAHHHRLASHFLEREIGAQGKSGSDLDPVERDLQVAPPETDAVNSAGQLCAGTAQRLSHG